MTELNENIEQMDFDQLQQLALDMRNSLGEVQKELEAVKVDMAALSQADSENKLERKKRMFVIQISALMVYLLMLATGFFYSLYDDYESFRYVLIVSSWLILVIFICRSSVDALKFESTMDQADSALRSIKTTMEDLEKDFKL